MISTTHKSISSELIFSLQSRKVRTFYYLIIVIIHFYMNRWLLNILPESLYFFHICFLTCMKFYFNLAYYILMLYLQITRNYRLMHTRFLKGFFKFIYSVSFLVFLCYWGLILINPFLLTTSSSPLPLLLDLFLHGANYVINLAEHVYVCPKDDCGEFGYLPYILFALFYSSLLQGLYAFFGVKLYPFVEKMNLIGFILINLIAFGIVLIGDFTYYKLMKSKGKNRKLHAD